MCVSCFLFIEFALVNEKKSFLGFGGVCNKMFDPACLEEVRRPWMAIGVELRRFAILQNRSCI